MKYSLLLIFTFISAFTLSQDTVRVKGEDGKYKDITIDEFFKYHNEPKISSEYKRGSFLIYDCLRKSFICVNSESFDLCQEKRVKARDEELENLSCAPMKKFKNQKECFKKQVEFIEKRSSKIFCFDRKKKLKLN